MANPPVAATTEAAAIPLFMVRRETREVVVFMTVSSFKVQPKC
jgi:hypothetical protein